MTETKARYNVSIERDDAGMPERLVYAAVPPSVADGSDEDWMNYKSVPLVPLVMDTAVANVTVHVPGIGNVRMSPDDALRMLFDDVLSHLELALFATHPDAAAIVAPYRARLAALVGDGG